VEATRVVPQAIYSPLIVDTDSAFLNGLLSHPLARDVPPVVIGSEKQAIIEIQDISKRFSGLFFNPDISNPVGIPLVRAILKDRPTLPLYFMVDSTWKGPTFSELDSLMIRKILPKPINYGDILKAVQEQRLPFDPENAMRIASMNPDPLGKELVANVDSDFIPILASNFFAGSTSYFDVYVRLISGKFLKILQAGDAFSRERIESYLKKVTHFHLRKEAQENYLRYCDQLASVILKKPLLPQGIKTILVSNQGQETASFLKQNGVSEASVQHAEGFVSNVKALMTELRFEKQAGLREFLLDLVSYEHGVATTMISSLLIRSLDFHAEKSVHTVGLSSMFHDVGMLGMPEKLKAEDDKELTQEELELYWTHPTLGATMLSTVKGVDVTVVQAVEQHHERRTRTGFPNRIGAGAMNRVAEIVGISQEFVGLIQRFNAGTLKNNPLVEMERRVFDGYSSQVCEGFRKVFGKK
jgi:hypothetical protein